MIACGDPIATPPAEQPAVVVDAGAGAAIVGDPLLAQARRSIAHGELAAEPKAAILASDAPAHARARALLTAMDAGRRPAATAELPPVPTASPTPAEVTPPTVAPELSGGAPPKPIPSKARPTVERLSMRATTSGASLTIHAGGGVLVGVANQPGAGVVRLVLDDVAAGAKVLGARPGVEGARVRSVDAGPRSVRITLELDPGWRFVGVRRTASGARVDLAGP